LEVVAKAIHLLNFYSGSFMCPATVRIISGLRSRRKNVKTVKLIFMNMAPVPEFSLFVASAYVRFF